MPSSFQRPCITLLAAILLTGGVPLRAAAAGESTNVRGSYLIGPTADYQTPKFLGVCLEVAENGDTSNLWDWLADSGAKMARVVHPDCDMRVNPSLMGKYGSIVTKKDFEAFRKGLLANPDKNIPWDNYRFDKNVPWLGIPDVEITKAMQAGVTPIISIAYGPSYYTESLLQKSYTGEIPAKDENINWAAAAAAYEYYLAVIHRYANRNGVTHYMMINEPPGDPKYAAQLGVIARMGRLAIEDVRSRLADKKAAAAMRLSGPACYSNAEQVWPYVQPYVDFLDSHFYNPDPEMFIRHYDRLAARARPFGKKLGFTEYNRIGGPLQPDEALWAMRPALQLGGLTMGVLKSGRAQDAGCEMALLYEFQAPATHRNFKSLVYGDMNLIDWSGCDKALNSAAKEWHPTPEELQIRFATPAYHVFKMLTRCTPGATGGKESYEVLSIGESSKGFGEIYDTTIFSNVYKALDEKKYYALGGAGPDIRVLAVRTPDRVLITVINNGPVVVKNVGFDLDMLKEPYLTAVVRETSLFHRDEVVAQMPITGKQVVTDLPSQSMIQIILLKEDLSKVSELKFEEVTATPGTIKDLGLFQTTRLRAMGRLGDRWMDLSELNIHWSSSDNRLVTVYQGGLVQRIRESAKQIAISAKTFAGNLQITQVVLPDKEGAKLSAGDQLPPNGTFENATATSGDPVPAWTTPQGGHWELGKSTAEGWVVKGKATPWNRSLEQNHTPGGVASMKLMTEADKSSVPDLVSAPPTKRGFELFARRYKVSAWVYRPASGGISKGVLGCEVKFNSSSKPPKSTLGSVLTFDSCEKPLELPLKNVADLPVGEWVQVSGEIAAPPEAASMTFDLTFGGNEKEAGSLYIDDVSLSAE